MVSGIYIIKNIVNNKVYIGQSQNCIARWRGHKHSLKNNKHYNQHLQRAYNQYLPSNFEYVMIEECTSDIIDEREQYWITYYNSTNYQYGYNNDSGGNFNKTHSKETKQRIANSHKGIRPSSETLLRLSESHKGQKPYYKVEATDEMINDVVNGMTKRMFYNKYGTYNVWSRINLLKRK